MNTLSLLSGKQRAELFSSLEETLPFAGAPTFMRLPQTRELSGVDVAVLGIPFDNGALNRPGARFGPRAIRTQSLYAATFQPVYPWEEQLTEHYRLIDYGDLAPLPGTGSVEFLLEASELVARDIFAAGASLLTLGGDHTLPYGLVRAAAKRHGKLALLHFDSHQDVGDSKAFGHGIQWISHGTFANDMAREGHINQSRSMQVFIRTHYPQPEVGDYRIIFAHDAARQTPEEIAATIKQHIGSTPVYLTFDIDAIDPAYAPGTGSPVPGGPSMTDMRRLLRALDGLNVVAADLVEVNPLYDPAETTAVSAAFLAIDLLHLLVHARKLRTI